MSHGRQANPDWGPVMWAVPSVVLPIVIGILITALTPWWPVWAAAAVLALVLAASVPKRGPLRPQNYGRTPATVIAATGLTVAFVVVLWATAQQGHPLAVEVLPGLLLWAAATLLLKPLNKSAHISETGLGIATLGMAVAALLAGFAVLHVGSTSGGAALFLLGIAFLLCGGFTVLHRRDNLLGIVALPLQRLAHGVRRIALAHPQVFPLIASRPPAAPWVRPPLRSLRWMENFLDNLIGCGFDDAAAVAAYRAFSSFLLGHLLLEVSAQGVDTGPVEGGWLIT